LNWDVSEKKVRKYLLNIDHREGRSKARFFPARGFTDADWQVLDQALRRHPIDNPVAAEEITEYGRKLIVRCQIKTPDGRNTCIRTVWMVEAGTRPRFVTAYPFSGR
jgi:hypothetical protein